MNAVARAKIDSIEHKRYVFRTVLSYFGELNGPTVSEKIAAAVDSAYADDLLFEDFEIWMEERNDKAFLYQIDHFFKTINNPTLPNGDLTGNTVEIENIQSEAEHNLAKTFAAKFKHLANQKNLKTNKEIGNYLGKNQEQIRVMLEGKHKPQRKTLLLVSEKFGVSAESLIED